MTGTVVVREVDAYGKPYVWYGQTHSAVVFLPADVWHISSIMQELFSQSIRNEVLAYYPGMTPTELRSGGISEGDLRWYADIEEQADE